MTAELPHTLLQELHVYLDYKQDESYTPSRLAVRAGSTYHDLKVSHARLSSGVLHGHATATVMGA